MSVILQGAPWPKNPNLKQDPYQNIPQQVPAPACLISDPPVYIQPFLATVFIKKAESCIVPL